MPHRISISRGVSFTVSSGGPGAGSGWFWVLRTMKRAIEAEIGECPATSSRTVAATAIFMGVRRADHVGDAHASAPTILSASASENTLVVVVRRFPADASESTNL